MTVVIMERVLRKRAVSIHLDDTHDSVHHGKEVGERGPVNMHLEDTYGSAHHGKRVEKRPSYHALLRYK